MTPLLVAIAVAASAAPTPPSTPTPDKVSAPGVYRGYSPELYAAWSRQAIYVPVRDGTRLAVTIWRPAVDGKAVTARLPVLFAFTPYHARDRAADGTITSAVEQARKGRPMVDMTRYGYVVVSADVRGKGASFGHRRGFQDRTEAKDGYDLVEWLARQPWSDGKVAMWGCSYVGGSQYQVASTAPPHLRAIFPGCADFDKYSFVSHGGLTAQFNTRSEDPVAVDAPTVPMDEDPQGVLLKQAVDGHAQNTPMADAWKGMPFRDSASPTLGDRYWEEASASTYRDVIRKSGIAIYHWGNFRDEVSGQVLLGWAALDNPGKLLMGGWGHCDPGDFDLFAEQLRFYDHYLKGVDNGVEREPPIYYYTIDAPPETAWRFADRWPLPQTRWTSFYLGASQGEGALAAQPGAVGADAKKVDYALTCPSFPMFWPCALDGYGVVYSTPPLERDLQVTGAGVARIWITSSTDDANVFGYLEDVAPDGQVEVVTHGRLKASHRKLSPAPFPTGGVPWRSDLAADAEPLKPGVPVELVFDFLPTSKVFKAGHRLRFVVTGADPRQRNIQEIAASTPAPTITVLRGGERASRLDLPVIPAS
jgi:predicted acyl esterase